jgi:hypothetical protein
MPQIFAEYVPLEASSKDCNPIPSDFDDFECLTEWRLLAYLCLMLNYAKRRKLWRLPAITAICLTFLFAAGLETQAQETPTTGVCLNRVTGAMSLQLANAAGVVKPCPKTALSTTLANLQAQPVMPASSSILVTRTIPAATEALVSQVTSSQPPTIIDVTGKTLGIFIGFDFTGNVYAEMTFKGTELEVPVTASGFTQTSIDDGPNILTFYSAANCGSPPLMQVEDSLSGLQVVNNGDDLNAIGGEPDNFAPSAAIIGNTIFYGAPPFSNPLLLSSMLFSNPANLNVITLGEGTCGSTQGQGTPSDVQYGAPAAANLSGFTPPFSILQQATEGD